MKGKEKDTDEIPQRSISLEITSVFVVNCVVA